MCYSLQRQDMRIYHYFCVLKSMSQDAMMSAECYYNCSSKKCPGKDFCGSCGDYCCIPEFESAFFTKFDRKRAKTSISLFKFPKDNTRKRRWIHVISMYWRRGAGDNFNPVY